MLPQLRRGANRPAGSVVYAATMHRLFTTVAVITLLALTGCNTADRRLREVNATNLPDSKTQAQIKKGIIEPGYTPEMVYLALGKPSEPAAGLADVTTNGTWVYHDFHRNDRDFIRAGFRRRVVFDPVKRTDTVITEPVDPRTFPNLRAHSLHVTFRDGRVVDIQRIAEL